MALPTWLPLSVAWHWYVHSVWEQQHFYQPSDLLIVGAGLTGLFSAIQIKQRFPERSIRVIEKGHFPAGASVKNAGFSCFGSPSELLDDINNEGEQSAAARLKLRHQGLQRLLEVAGSNYIDYQQNDGFELFSEKEIELYLSCREQLPYLNQLSQQQLGYAAYEEVAADNFSFKNIIGAFRIKGEGQLNSGKLIKRLLSIAQSLGVELLFGADASYISARSSGGWQVSGAGFSFKAARLLLATNAFTPRLLPELNITPGRGQVLLTAPIAGLNLRGTYHLEQGYYYFREYESRILLGGGRHLDRAGESTSEEGLSDTIQEALEKLLYEVILPGEKPAIEQRWSGIMAFGANNEKEVIVTEHKPGLWVAARLGGMGIAISSQVAAGIAEKINL